MAEKCTVHPREGRKDESNQPESGHRDCRTFQEEGLAGTKTSSVVKRDMSQQKSTGTCV